MARLRREIGARRAHNFATGVNHSFGIKRNEWQVEVYPELRVQVTATRFRIPDITVQPPD
jgi:hypothetical protein